MNVVKLASLITNRLVAVRGGYRLSQAVARRLEGRRELVRKRIMGSDFILDPAQRSNWDLLYRSSLYDVDEVAFLIGNLRPGDAFIDGGASIGFYTMLGSRLVENSGSVLSIEPAPRTFVRLKENIALNRRSNIVALNLALSDREGTQQLAVYHRDCEANSLLHADGADELVPVKCARLGQLLNDHGFERIDGMKLDLQDYELRVLRDFLANVSRSRYPRFILAEFRPEYQQEALALLEHAGYCEAMRTRSCNFGFVRPVGVGPHDRKAR